MDDRWGLEGLETELEALDRTMGQTQGVTATFAATLREMQGTLGETARDLGKLERGFAGGIRRAIDGVVIDGMKLSEALGVVGRAMIDTVYAAAVRPVASHLGGLLAQGLNAVVGGVLPQADGAPFSQGRVMPFASGGVVTAPTFFPMRGGLGLMGEAGPEAIMPLARGPDGRLGVRARGGGATVNVTMNITTPDAASFARSRTQVAAELSRAMSRAGRNG